MGGIFFIIGLIAIIPSIILFLIGGVMPIIIGILWIIIVFAILSVIQTSVDGILIASLYYYATTGNIPEVLENGMAEKIFVKK